MLTLNKFNLLIVEDDEPKLKAVLALIAESIRASNVFQARSLAKALKIIAENQIDFCILDMSLPAFDLETDMTGSGQPQDYGGRDVLRFLEDEMPLCKSIILTQHGEFVSRAGTPQKLDQLSQELQEEFGNNLLEVIYYSGQRGEWREKVILHLNQLGNQT